MRPRFSSELSRLCVGIQRIACSFVVSIMTQPIEQPESGRQGGEWKHTLRSGKMPYSCQTSCDEHYCLYLLQDVQRMWGIYVRETPITPWIANVGCRRVYKTRRAILKCPNPSHVSRANDIASQHHAPTVDSQSAAKSWRGLTKRYWKDSGRRKRSHPPGLCKWHCHKHTSLSHLHIATLKLTLYKSYRHRNFAQTYVVGTSTLRYWMT